VFNRIKKARKPLNPLSQEQKDFMLNHLDGASEVQSFIPFA